MNDLSIFPPWADIVDNRATKPVYTLRNRNGRAFLVKTTKSMVLYRHHDAEYRDIAVICIKHKRDRLRTPIKITLKLFNQDVAEFDYSEEGYNNCIQHIKDKLITVRTLIEDIMNEGYKKLQ